MGNPDGPDMVHRTFLYTDTDQIICHRFSVGLIDTEPCTYIVLFNLTLAEPFTVFTQSFSTPCLKTLYELYTLYLYQLCFIYYDYYIQ